MVEDISPPESPKSGYRRHWGWDGDAFVPSACVESHYSDIAVTGAAMSAPWSLYHTLNGFDEELDDGDDSQVSCGSVDAGRAC